MPVSTYNRTIEELKFINDVDRSVIGKSYNRTIGKLKFSGTHVFPDGDSANIIFLVSFKR